MKIKFIIFLSAILMSLAATNSNAQQDVNGWYWINGQPVGQQINWVNVFDAANMFAVTNRGLFMKSTDGGDTWTITQAGAYDGSTTSGDSKRNLTTGWFFNGNVGLVAGASQTSPNATVIQKTINGGATFNTIVINGVSGVTINGFYFINATTGYLCGGANALLYKTTDQGDTWTAVPNVPSNTYYSIHAIDENNILLGSSSRRIVRTTNAGTTWITDTLFTAATNVQFLGMTFKDANTGYVIGNPNYFAYTTNAGVNWTASTHSSTKGQRSIVYDNGVVWTAGDYEYVYSSSNNGVTWDSVKFYDNSNPNQPAPFIIWGIGAKGNDFAVVGSDGQMTTSNDGGASWRNKNYTVGNLFNYSIYNTDPTGDMWVSGNSGGMMFSSNGGTNWSTQTTSHTESIYDVDFVNSSTGFIAGGRANSLLGEFSNTANGGATWNYIALPSPFNSYQMNSVDFVNANTGWIGGIQGPFSPAIIGKSTDGGATWVQQSIETSPNGGVTKIEMIDANVGYFVGNSLYSTTNGGTNWVKNINPYVTGTSWSSMDVLNKDVIFLCGGGTGGAKKVIKTLDGGLTWTDVTSNLSTAPMTAFRTEWLNLLHGTVSGTNGLNAITTNGGATWTTSNPGFSTTVALSFPEKNTWFTASDRNGSYQIGRKFESNTSISVNVTMSIEGFWNGKPMVQDTVTIELHNSTSPFALVDSKSAYVTRNGYQTYEFTSVASGSYYIVIKHRNGLETWSAAPIAMNQGDNINYDFTTASSMAFGNNMVLKAGEYCIYSGDANQDGVIDATDLGLIDNDAFSFVSGYVSTDCNGDNVIDLTDAGIADNNANNFVQVIKP